MRVPDSLLHLRSRPRGAAWLKELPGMVEACCQDWGLRLADCRPFDSHAAYVTPVLLADGSEAVFKVNFPNDESKHEADALQAWGGEACVELLARSDVARALLLERCRQGNQLWSIEDDAAATSIAAGVMRRLWRPPALTNPFRPLADEARRWQGQLPRQYAALGTPYERSILDEALEALRDLMATPGEPVLLHQDLHGGNVISAQREPWLAIDPKPLAGEREFDVASLLRDRRWLLMKQGGRELVRRRLDILADELGLDRERMRLWGIVHALAWAGSDEDAEPVELSAAHVYAARLLHEARRR